MDTRDLTASLDTLDGWKRINKKSFIFFGGGAKSFGVWQAGSSRGVFENHVLHESEYEDFRYYIHAFSTEGEIASERLDELKSAASGVDLNVLRYESQSYASLSPIRGGLGSDDPEEHSIAQLGAPGSGLFVYAWADDKRAFPAVAYACVDGKHNIFPIDAKFVR